MSKVFIGGSRHVSRLTDEVKQRLDKIISNGFQVIVGDAGGADSAVQRHLLGAAYQNVVVFCSGEHARNNLGSWGTHNVTTTKNLKGFQFFAAKDRAMALEADFGLMIWDGKSPGTALNVLRLVRAGKKAVLLNVPDKKVTTFKTTNDWKDFISKCDKEVLNDLRERATPDEWINSEELAIPRQASLLDTPDVEEIDLGDPTLQKEIRGHLSAINKALASGDLASVMEAFGHVAKSRGMSHIAREAGLARESLYRALGSGGNPEFATVLKVMESVGLRLMVCEVKGDGANSSSTSSNAAKTKKSRLRSIRSPEKMQETS